jgi:amino acid transporter
MRGRISTIGLLFASISAILGSGWLFSAYYTSTYAGPASILSWVIGGILVMIIAFVYAELCTMIPITGSSTRIPHLTHGTFVSFSFSWIIWISYLTLAPIEVQAIIQYVSVYHPAFLNPDLSLSLQGFGLAFVLLLLICIINTYSLRWLIKANNFLTVLKLIIPIFIGIVILMVALSSSGPSHISLSKETFAPYGVHGIVAAISSGGIAFAFTGFKIAAEMAGDTENPRKSIPIAVIGSIVICLAIFILLQFAFLNSISHENLLNGWKNLSLSADFGPFASIATQENITFLIPIIFAGAIIGPLAAGLMYFGSAARSIYGMSLNKQLPGIFKMLSPKGVPTFAIILNFLVGLIMFAPLPGWKAMAEFLTSLVAFTYVVAPICVYTLRIELPHHVRPFRLLMGRMWSIFALYASTLIVYWTGWNTVSKMGIAMLIGVVVFFIYQKFQKDENKVEWNMRQSIWLWIYVIGITLISYTGNFGGGHEILGTLESMLALFVLCVICNHIAVRWSLGHDNISKRINQAITEDQIEMLRSAS